MCSLIFQIHPESTYKLELVSMSILDCYTMENHNGILTLVSMSSLETNNKVSCVNNSA